MMADHAVLTEWSVVRPTTAAEQLPMRLGDALEWLREAGVIRRVRGREVVIWGDVLKKIREDLEGSVPANLIPPPAPIRPPSNLPRADLSGRKR